MDISCALFKLFKSVHRKATQAYKDYWVVIKKNYLIHEFCTIFMFLFK